MRIYSRKVNYLFHDCSEALLKIKQAFRSAAVDLPPEESTAPYHSITLPETFHLDDFELPDSGSVLDIAFSIAYMHSSNFFIYDYDDGVVSMLELTFLVLYEFDLCFGSDFVDHHVSTKEQITLQDTVGGMEFSSMQFGSDGLLSSQST